MQELTPSATQTAMFCARRSRTSRRCRPPIVAMRGASAPQAIQSRPFRKSAPLQSEPPPVMRRLITSCAVKSRVSPTTIEASLRGRARAGGSRGDCETTRSMVGIIEAATWLRKRRGVDDSEPGTNPLLHGPFAPVCRLPVREPALLAPI